MPSSCIRAFDLILPHPQASHAPSLEVLPDAPPGQNRMIFLCVSIAHCA